MSLVERLDALARRDRELALFGADAHYHRRLAPLAPEDVVALEARLEAALPADVRTYLLDVSAGGVGPGYGLLYLPALLVDPSLDDDAWVADVARRAFADDDGEQWAAERFVPLTEAQIDQRVVSMNLPEPIAARLRQSGESSRTFEGRRNRYLSLVTDSLRDLPRGPCELLPLSNDGCGRFAALALGPRDYGQIKMLDLETSLTTPHAPSFGAWIASWLDTCERDLAEGIEPRGRMLWT